MTSLRKILLAVLWLGIGAGCAGTLSKANPPPTPTSLPPTPQPTQLPPSPIPTQAPPNTTPSPPTAPETAALAPTATLDPAVFELRSLVFGMEQNIPRRFTCNDKDISPPLIWGNPPEGTQSFVLLMDDITVGNFVHWVFYNIPSDTRALPEAVPTKDHFEDGSQQGINQTFEAGYFGPCPMPGPNRYRFRLFALDINLELEDRVMMIPLKAAMEGHILAETELIGVYP